MTRVACMGGWCAKRDTCRLYHAVDGLPIERLCEQGQLDAYEPVRVIKPAGTWERQNRGLAYATWVDAILD